MIELEEDIATTLEKQFYVNVPFPIPHWQIIEAMDAFFKFLDEPEEVKTYIDCKIAERHRRGDVGFKHREPGDDREDIYNDSKDFFHFHPAIFEKYQDFLGANPVVKDFMNKAQPIWEAVVSVMRGILGKFEPEFPGILSYIFDTKPPHIIIRFLKYNWQNSGKYLAKPHFDAGSFTLGIAESCPGLRIGSCPENLTPVHHKEGNAVFMFSSNFRKIMNTDRFSPGWHDVIQLDETIIGKPFARWAMVAFIEADVEALPRSETHKWYVV